MMKVVILAGGFGTRLSEETVLKPKPMIEIGGKPILWHIMKYYSCFGFNEFIVALGYRGDDIKDYFANKYRLMGNLVIDLEEREIYSSEKHPDNWKIHLIETGTTTMTGGRIKQLEQLLRNETFLLTYGDGVSDVNIHDLIEFHNGKKSMVTITAVHPPSRFGGITFSDDKIIRFSEKSQIDVGWVNGGYMVLEPDIFSYFEGDEDILEVSLLERMASENNLHGYKHDGFWQCMDTLRDKNFLENIWANGNAPWKIW